MPLQFTRAPEPDPKPEPADLAEQVRALAAVVEQQTRTIAALATASAVPRASVTFGQVWERYSEAHRHVEWWAKSAAYVARAVRRFEARPLSEITRADWSSYVAQERAHTAKSSQRFELRRFRAMIRWAREEGIVGPALHPWELGRMSHDPRRKTKLEDDDFERALAVASPIFRVYLLCVRFSGGLRRREALHLQWSWIDMSTGIVQLPGEAMIDGRVQGVAKGRRGRTTFLEMRAIRALETLPRVVGDDRVFVNRARDQTYSLDWPTMEWSRLRERVGIKAAPSEVARLHDARGTQASALLADGADLLAVCEAFGWRDFATAERYRRSGEEDVARLAASRRGPRRAEIVKSDVAEIRQAKK